jgi:hypothetical protein
MKNVIIALFALVSVQAIAQDDVSISQSVEDLQGKVRIKVNKKQNGKTTEFDRTYNTEGMSNDEKQTLIDRVTDSVALGNSSGKQRGMKFRIETDRYTDRGEKTDRGNRPRGDKDGNDDRTRRFDFDFDTKDMFDEKTFRKHFEDLSSRFKDMDIKILDGDSPQTFTWKGGKESGSSKTVKSLKIYPNNPFNGRLNLEFNTPQKGDVNIIVTDVAGKEVGRELIKDFEGQYVGQIELKKAAAKGVFFVTVTQNQDGAVKRIEVE